MFDLQVTILRLETENQWCYAFTPVEESWPPQSTFISYFTLCQINTDLASNETFIARLELGTYITFASNGYVVISVDYRLAPEDPYPAAFNDGETAWNWLHTKEAATSLGLDVTRFGLFGTSAGSWLSTGLAIRLKDKNSFEQPRIAICDR